jgi:hypothetical protein
MPSTSVNIRRHRRTFRSALWPSTELGNRARSPVLVWVCRVDFFVRKAAAVLNVSDVRAMLCQRTGSGSRGSPTVMRFTLICVIILAHLDLTAPVQTGASVAGSLCGMSEHSLSSAHTKSETR